MTPPQKGPHSLDFDFCRFTLYTTLVSGLPLLLLLPLWDQRRRVKKSLKNFPHCFWTLGILFSTPQDRTSRLLLYFTLSAEQRSLLCSTSCSIQAQDAGGKQYWIHNSLGCISNCGVLSWSTCLYLHFSFKTSGHASYQGFMFELVRNKRRSKN